MEFVLFGKEIFLYRKEGEGWCLSTILKAGLRRIEH